MAEFSKTITINAPVEKIFDYMDDPHNLKVIWPSLQEVSDVGKLPNGGVCYKYATKVAGIRLEGYSEDVEHIQNVRTVSKSSGGVEYLTTVAFEPASPGTKVTLTMAYKIPVPVLGKLAESVLVKMTEQEAVSLLANLKAQMEGQ